MEYSQHKDHIKQFLRGKLSKQEEIKLLSWIKESTVNRKRFLDLQKSFSRELKSHAGETSEKSWQQLTGRFEPETTKKRYLPGFKTYFQLTAFLAAAFFIGFFFATWLNSTEVKPEKQAPVLQKISAPFGARTQFKLPDNSTVWLNSGSEIEFPSHFSDVRNITLNGEAFFEVSKDEIPFVVSSIFGDVEVKGTSFNVKAYHNDSFETTLIEGKVDVTTKNGNKTTLQPGYQAVYRENELNTMKVDTELYTSWTKGQLIFRREYLPRMAQRLGKWYNVTILLDNDKRLESIHYTATIEMESFSEVLNLLKVTAPVNYSWNEKTRTIRLFYEK